MGTAEAVNTISDSLDEKEEQPKKQIAEIVEVLGADVALELLAETRRVQTEGGLAVRDGTRRRTDGGVFFSLAKSKLPRADRNRIFRVRLPKPPESESGSVEQPATSSPKQAPPAGEPVRSRGSAPTVVRDVVAGGRRRVVEVEVLRQHVKPAPVAAPIRLTPAAPPRAAERPPEPEVRPLRRIVTIGAAREEPPPSTPAAAKERVRAVLRGLGPEDQRQVLAELLREAGGGAPVAVESAPKPKESVDPRLRERVLASVTEALGLSSGDLAKVLFGEDTPGTKSKARLALDRWRKSKGE